MSAVAIMPILTMPRSSPHCTCGDVVYVPRPVTQADRDFGLYVMIFAIVGMVMVGLWWALFLRHRR